MTERESKDRALGLPIWLRDTGYWYGDFRAVGGPSRKSLGTSDRAEAEEELARLKSEYREKADAETALDDDDPLLQDFAQRHLDRMESEDTARKTWNEAERALGYLCTILGRRLDHEPRLSDVTVGRLEDWYVPWRQESVMNSTIRSELASISAMLSRAQRRQVVDRNAARLMQKPADDSAEPEWLTIGEAARVLETAGELVEDSSSRVLPFFQELIGTYLLAGGRREGVFGLTREDIDLEAGEVRFRSNEWRDLKNEHSERDVPLWPQLRELLEPYLCGRTDDHPLLFPSRSGTMLSDPRSAFETLEEETEDMDKHLTPKVFRHTYCATRIQTVDHGEPVALYTVARELGHTDVERIKDTYGHLAKNRVRLPEVRYQEADVVDLDEARQQTA